MATALLSAPLKHWGDFMRKASVGFSLAFLFSQTLGLILFASQAQAVIPDPRSSCVALFENTETGTHGWFDSRRDYGLGVGTIDCLNQNVEPASITVHASISAISGIGMVGSTPDHDTNACVDAGKCSTQIIESNGAPEDHFNGETCFKWVVKGSTSLEADGSARVVSPETDIICAP